MDRKTQIIVAVITSSSVVVAAVITGLFTMYSSNSDSVKVAGPLTKNSDLTPAVSNQKQSNYIASGEKTFSIILPNELAIKIETIKKSKIEYPDRSRQLDSINRAIENGDFELAAIYAKEVNERQQNLRTIRDKGIPTGLTDQLKVIDTEKIEYPDRSRQMESIDNAIKNGDIELAEIYAKDIIERQRNLRGIGN